MKKTKDELYEEFKSTDFKALSYLGLSQGLCFIIMVIGFIGLMWVDWWLILKIELTALVTAIIISIAYHQLDKFLRKQFDNVYKDVFND